MNRTTVVSIQGQAFHLNGRPTYEGRSWRGFKVEGLLMNSRMVQGIFDDRNPETRHLWNYPDGPWDPKRHTREFLAAMPEWRRHGLLAFTINLQGGCPIGYPTGPQRWHNSAFEADGRLRADYLARLEPIVNRAAALGMVVILGYFYFGQDERLSNEAAVLRATDAATDWILTKGYTNVLVEINNECNTAYEHAILNPPRVHELIERVAKRLAGQVRSPAGRLLAGTCLGGGSLPPPNIVAASDFILLHGNGVGDPNCIRRMVDEVRAGQAYRGQPILFNEDDHFDFEKPDNNLVAAVSRYASWGYFDYRMKGEGFNEGFQSVPANWGISSARKRGFFNLLAEISGPQAKK